MLYLSNAPVSIRVILHQFITLTPLYWSQKVVENWGKLQTIKSFGGQPKGQPLYLFIFFNSDTALGSFLLSLCQTLTIFSYL